MRSMLYAKVNAVMDNYSRQTLSQKSFYRKLRVTLRKTRNNGAHIGFAAIFSNNLRIGVYSNLFYTGRNFDFQTDIFLVSKRQIFTSKILKW